MKRINSLFAFEKARPGPYLFFFSWQDSSQWASASSFNRSLDHTQRRTTVGWTPLDE